MALWLYGSEIKTDQDYNKRYENNFFQDQEILHWLHWLENKEVIIGKSSTVPDYRSLGFFIDKASNNIHYVDWMLGTDIRDAFNPLVLQDGRVYGSLDRDEFEYLLDQIPADDRSMLRNPNFEIVEGENPVLVSFKVKFPN
jgi:hypothetical protein